MLRTAFPRRCRQRGTDPAILVSYTGLEIRAMRLIFAKGKHARQRCEPERRDTVAQIDPSMHIHDSFGVPKTIWTYNPAEDAAMGMGDLHLPPGWGNLPFDRLMREGTLPADAVFMIELHPRCWDALGETVEATRRLMEKAARGSAPAAA